MVGVHRAIVAGKSEIEAAVALAETKTSGEIIVCVMRQAGNYGLETSAIAFVLALVSYAAGRGFFPKLFNPPDWSPLLFGLSAFAGGFGAGLLLAGVTPALPLLLTTKKRRQRYAERAAVLAFHDLHVERCRAHTGVLILIAEAERTVAVLGDAPIACQISSGDWEGIRDAILAGIRDSKPVEGIVRGIELAGDLLGRSFPPQAHPRNELPNKLIVT